MRNTEIPLEDTWVDVMRKAKRGLGFSDQELARRSNLPDEAITRLLAGEFDPEAMVRASSVMGLDACAQMALARGDYHPGGIVLPEVVAMFNSDWNGMQVHSYLAWDPQTREAVAFDTGADASEVMEFLHWQGLRLKLLLLTHGHGDHLFDLGRLTEKTGAEAWIGEGEGVSGIACFAAGKSFQVGSLQIQTRLTWGHSAGGVTYVLHGLAKPLAVVGDALFAGSMGGPLVSYPDCLRTNREEILSLPQETILCPGHGPLTTVALELENNPFFPKGF